MTDVSDVSAKGLPTSATLLRACAVAILVAAVVLVVAVLPAEYGIDPTGIGKRLGLTALSHSSSGAASGPVWKSASAFRSDETSVSLDPGKGIEVKALMEAGDSFVFAWNTNGDLVNFDMHGEEPHAADDQYTSYWKERKASSANGAFVAPFAGSHGWYWKNTGTAPVKITVRTSGHYEKLYVP